MAKRPTEPKTYETSIVGESHYRDAVKATKVGDYVDLVIEQGNPHADEGIALRVDNMDGDTVGYILSDSWLFRAIVKEGKGCLAKVEFKGGRPAGLRLRVQLGGEKPPTVQYGDRLTPSKPSGGCLGVLVALVVVPAVGVVEKLV
ncbi:hypothetical protein [Erythrobacter sp. QSSC1-22B]|uniref:hypothetical protein n=1 Tax=Erythrobacter sp. QSSC1-22B TaxID=1860125 RepID=UPI0011A10927|nr:hypothetical protein [Erythrobacter sp. QSSC1-22B]